LAPTIRLGLGADLLTASVGANGATVNVAALLTGPAVPVSVLLTPALVLTYDPATVDVTLTVTTHVELAATVPPLKLTEPPPATAVATPPMHVVAALGVAALTKSVGYISVKLIPLSGELLGLVIVSVSTLTSPLVIEARLKLFAIVGFGNTSKATGPAPVPAVGVCVVVTPLTLFGLLPRFVLVTCTSTVQPPGGRFGTVKFNAFSPVAPTNSAGELITPAHVPPIVVDATLMLRSVSVKLALFKIETFALPSVNLMVLISPLPIVLGTNVLAIVGDVKGGAVTIKFADAVVLVLALVEITVPVVLVTPGEAATTELVTLTLILQLAVPPALNGTVAPLMDIDVSFARVPAVTVPPQVLVKPGVENTFIPAGKISLQATPVIACVVDGLTIVSSMVDAVFATMVEGLKLLLTIGAAKRTDNGAEAATVFPPPFVVFKKPAVGDAGMVFV
jgi:hypothetical protein